MENRLKSDMRSTNSFYASKSGFITTYTQGSEEEDIRKSRIEHLPSYRRENLSGKLQFVVVFQTIEIERLSLEIESLRVMLKDADRQIHNYLNYEVQIKELTENCHQLEEQRTNYQNQVEQMSLACNSLYEQLNDCKQQYQQEIEELHRQFAAQQKELSNHNNALRQTVTQLEKELRKKDDNEREAQNKVKAISQELVRLNQNLYQGQNELAQLKDSQLRKAEELNRLQQEVKDWQNSAQQEKWQVEEKKQRLQKDKQDKESTIRKLQAEKQQLGTELEKKKNETLSMRQQWEQDQKQLDVCKRELAGALQENDSIKGEFFNLQEEYNNIVNHLNHSQAANQQLAQQMKGLTDAIGKEKKRSADIEGFAHELQGRIEAKCKELDEFQTYLADIDREWQAKSKNESELTQKLLAFEPLIAQNDSLKQTVYQLNCKVVQREEELSDKSQDLMELSMQNKEMSHQIAQLQNSCQRSQAELEQFEKRLEKERQSYENDRKRVVAEYQQVIERQSAQKRSISNQKDQLERQIERIKADGLIKEELRSEVKKLGEKCKRQEKDIETMKSRFDNVNNHLKKLHEKCGSFTEVEKTNTLLKKQVDASLALTDQMLRKMEGLHQEIEQLTDQNWKLSDKLREETSKDEFSVPATSIKTINSAAGVSSSSRFSGVKPFESSVLRGRAPEYSPATNQQTYSSGYSTERLNFNADINLPRMSKAKSIIGEDLGVKRVLEPSSYYPSRDSNYSSSTYSSVIGQLSSRDSAYGLQRRERR